MENSVVTAKRPVRRGKSRERTGSDLELLSLGRSLYRACGIEAGDDPDSDAVPVLPEWGDNICAQLRLTIFKRLLQLRPATATIDWRNLGNILGVGMRMLGFFGYDLPGLEPEPQSPGHPNESSAEIPGENSEPREDGDALLTRLGKLLGDLFRAALSQNPLRQEVFWRGLAEGYELLLDGQGQFCGDRGRTAVYFELLSRWPQIEQMRRSTPSPTRLNLYTLIAPGLGDQTRERLAWFNDVCDDIGLPMKEPGRPVR